MRRGSSPGSGPRSQAEKEAASVEVAYALVGGTLVAGVTYALFLLPGVLFSVPPPMERGLLVVGGLLAGVLSLAHMARVLWRFRAERIDRELGRLLRDADE